MDTVDTRVLVAYASRMGSTREIAEAVAGRLAASGFEVTVQPAAQVASVRPYRAVVLGSALYVGRWRPEAVAFLRRHEADLRERPVWLFHSGPLAGDSTVPQRPPRRVARLAGRIGTAPPTTFGGAVLPERARGFVARRMSRGPLGGDFRPWDAVRDWADAIAARLTARTR